MICRGSKATRTVSQDVPLKSEKWTLVYSLFTICNILMKLHRYIENLELHIVANVVCYSGCSIS